VEPGAGWEDAYAVAREAVLAGELIAFPTDTVYGLGGDAGNPEAIQRIYQAKNRSPQKAIPVLTGSIEAGLSLFSVGGEDARRLAEAFWPGPLTIVAHAEPAADLAVSSDDATVAVRVPGHEVALEVLNAAGVPMAVTSANRAGEPEARYPLDVLRTLGDSVAVIIDAPCGDEASPSTVVSIAAEPPRILRVGPVTSKELEDALGRRVVVLV
jgi:tRNA threonylcarbamoyl adenosine modification protein (Sua5/YciO/YrdC/YwlC family)